MTTKYLSPIGNGDHFHASDGSLLNGGLLYSYLTGTTTLLSTYKDNAGAVAHANPIVLNSRGEVGDEVYLDTDASYKFVLKTSAAATLWTEDPVIGIKDNTAAATESNWLQGPAATYLSATTFSVAGDYSTTLHVGRRLRIVLAGGTKYATITAASYSAGTGLTTLAVAVDAAAALTNPISNMDYGVEPAANPSQVGRRAIVLTDATQTIVVPAGGADYVMTPTAARTVTVDGANLIAGDPVSFLNLAAAYKLTLNGDGGAALAAFQDGYMELRALGADPQEIANWKICAVEGGASPKVWAYRSAALSGQNLTTTTEIVLDADVYDTNSNFSVSTGRFTPTVAGKYLACVSGRLANWTPAAGGAFAECRKNGLNTAGNRISATIHLEDSAATTGHGTTSGVVDLNGSTDYLSMFMLADTDTSVDIVVGSNLTFLSISRIA